MLFLLGINWVVKSVLRLKIKEFGDYEGNFLSLQ